MLQYYVKEDPQRVRLHVHTGATAARSDVTRPLTSYEDERERDGAAPWHASENILTRTDAFDGWNGAPPREGGVAISPSL